MNQDSIIGMGGRPSDIGYDNRSQNTMDTMTAEGHFGMTGNSMGPNNATRRTNNFMGSIRTSQISSGSNSRERQLSNEPVNSNLPMPMGFQLA